MGVQEILAQYLQTLDEQTRVVLMEVILAEQRVIDMERPRVKEHIKEVIDAEVRAEEGRT